MFSEMIVVLSCFFTNYYYNAIYSRENASNSEARYILKDSVHQTLFHRKKLLNFIYRQNKAYVGAKASSSSNIDKQNK